MASSRIISVFKTLEGHRYTMSDISASFLFLMANIVITSKALVTRSDALVPSSDALVTTSKALVGTYPARPAGPAAERVLRLGAKGAPPPGRCASQGGYGRDIGSNLELSRTTMMTKLGIPKESLLVKQTAPSSKSVLSQPTLSDFDMFVGAKQDVSKGSNSVKGGERWMSPFVLRLGPRSGLYTLV